MAKMTKAVQKAKQDQEALEYAKVRAAIYPIELMNLLEKATAENFKIEVKDQKFQIKDRDNARSKTFELPIVWSNEAEIGWFDLDFEIDDKARVRKEQEERAEKIMAARNKLTWDERKLLGIE